MVNWFKSWPGDGWSYSWYSSFIIYGYGMTSNFRPPLGFPVHPCIREISSLISKLFVFIERNRIENEDKSCDIFRKNAIGSLIIQNRRFARTEFYCFTDLFLAIVNSNFCHRFPNAFRLTLYCALFNLTKNVRIYAIFNEEISLLSAIRRSRC